MKKIITILSASFLLAASALADTGMVGVKYGLGDLEATKGSYAAGGHTYAAQTASEDHEYGAIFLEINMPSVEGLSAGIELIPFTATLTVDGNSADSHLELSDYTTLYGLYSRDMGDMSAYIKAGYSMADIGNVTANYIGTTINSHDTSLEGPMVGIGISKDLAEITARLEATYTDFDTVAVTTTSNASASARKAADAELTTISVSIAKSF